MSVATGELEATTRNFLALLDAKFKTAFAQQMRL